MGIIDWFKRLVIPEPRTPAAAAASVQKPGAPYRKPADRKDREYSCTFKVDGDDGRGQDEVNRLVQKAERRARRHFAGKEVKHRVKSKTSDTIEFAFFRRSGKPLTVRVTRENPLA